MRVIEAVEDARLWRQDVMGSLGLVPTMGYLHDGHLKLIRCARSENDLVAVTIFVNPTQFGPNDDFERYPRDVPRDLDLLRQERVDLVLTPNIAEMYPDGFSTYVTVGPIAERLEGAARPDHFRGVATVVAKLFNIFRPTRAYLGQKDAQQLVVVRKMVADLAFPLEVVSVPTVRDADGIALSSRNTYLSPEQRTAARAISRGLFAANRLYDDGERRAETLRQSVRKELDSEPLIQIEYVSVVDEQTLEEPCFIEDTALLSLAAKVGQIRLIDNVILGRSEQEGAVPPLC